MSTETTKFYESDFQRGLFPMSTNSVVIGNFHTKIDEIIEETKSPLTFLPQERVHAAKSGPHVRRTVKLDPVAEYFIYDLIYRNRRKFRRDHRPNRQNFGFKFREGTLMNAAEAYTSFKAAISQAGREFKYVIKSDISCYFNSVYQHDLVNWFVEINADGQDSELFGQFLRKTNSGRSIDCLPQGIAPCKVIGSHFLRFIDNSGLLQSELLLRFMDDIYIFGNDWQVLQADFYRVQELLGLKGLDLNPSKTSDSVSAHVEEGIEAIKIELLQMRRKLVAASGGDDLDEDGPNGPQLTERHVEFLMNLLKSHDIEEEDAELVLTLLRERAENALQHIEPIIAKFPNLIKNIYTFAAQIHDRSGFSSMLLHTVQSNAFLSEYQLFWIAKIAESFLHAEDTYGDLLISLLTHRRATTISKAKILEIPESRFGLDDIREAHLRSGRSDWLCWASATGTRSLPPSMRNHVLSYFGNASLMNALISECIQTL